MPVLIAHAATKSGSEHSQSDALFPPFDPSTFSSQIFWLALTFGCLYFFMAKVALPRIGNILEVRQNRISQDLVEAQRLKDETDVSIAAREQKLTEARNKAHIIVRKANEKAKTIADAERKKTEMDLAKKLVSAEQHIRTISNAAIAEINNLAEATAEAIVSHLTGEKITRVELARAFKETTG